METKLFRIYDMKWDCENPKKCFANDGTKLSDLTDFIFECEIYDDDDVADRLIDLVSDWSGWCHYGFNFKEIN